MNLYKDHKINNSLRINALTRYFAEVKYIENYLSVKSSFFELSP